MTEYVQVKFNPWDQRSYTYESDLLSIKQGDKVEVKTKDGIKVVTVESVGGEKPDFKCKKILRQVLS